MNFIDAWQAKLKADELRIDGLRKEVRDLLTANPPDSVKFFAKNGLREFADNGDTTAISEITLAWLTGMEKAGAEPSAALREFLQAESQHNGILRDAKNERAALAGAADANLDPADLHKRADKWEKIYEAHKGTNSECGSVASDMMQYLHSRARQIQLARPVRMGGDDRTVMSGAELKRLRDNRREIIAAAANPPKGYCKQCNEWRARPDLLGLMLSVYLCVPPVNQNGKTFASNAGTFQIRVRSGRAYAFRKGDQEKYEKLGADIFAIAGKLIGIGREEKADFPAQAAAVNALIKCARVVSPNALADLCEWHSPAPAPAVAARIAAGEPAGGARIAGAYQTPLEKRPPVRPRTWGDWGIFRACHWRIVGKVGAAIMAPVMLAHPPKLTTDKQKRSYTPPLKNMSDAELMARMTSAAESREAAGHAFRLLRDSGLLERLRGIREYDAWKGCLWDLLKMFAMRRRCVRLRAVIVVVWQAFKGGRFNDSASRAWHSIIALAKEAGCSRETMRKVLKALEADGMLTRGFGNGCASYCLIKYFTITAANAIYDALGKGAEWGRLTIAAVAKRFAPTPPATAPPAC